MADYDKQAYKDAVKIAKAAFKGGQIGITAIDRYIDAIYSSLARIRRGEDLQSR